MKISFLVTYYQQEKYVRESMDSLLTLEKPEEWEILIGDDGSGDGTAAAAQVYVDRDPEHIHLFVMDREPGKKELSVARASANRLNLLRRATGDCYCLMDGDDFYSEPDFVSRAIQLLEQHPEVNVVAFDTWKYPDGSETRRKQGGSGRAGFMPRRKYLRWQYTHAGACVFRRDETEESLRNLAGLGCFDDNDIMMNALSRGKMIRVRRPVYAYRQERGSIYAVMNPAERAALNVWGMGVSLRMMGPRWERDVMARYASAVWMAWLLREKLPEMLDPARYAAYLEGCRRVGFARGEKLLRFPELDAAERRELRAWVRRVGRESPPRVAYAWTQTRPSRIACGKAESGI